MSPRTRRLAVPTLLASLLALAACASAPGRPTPRRPPNIVIVFADDMGWGDLDVQGAHGFTTPNLDRLAAEGRRFTDFYVSQPVCGASRASLLTGIYANRIGLNGAPDHRSRIGIAPGETTLGELLQAQGYATEIVGKWHLGCLPPFLPTRNGFDQWFGLPYSNDMWPFHPEWPNAYPPLPLYDGEKVIETNPSMDTLTQRYTEHALAFIDAHADEPFFLYFAHSMPHVPLGASQSWRGSSDRGLYGDVIQELDASVGAVLDSLERHGIADDTLVLFTSDNGPWLSYGDHAGSAGPFREGKGTTFEGGVREPCIARWPGHVPAGTTCAEPLMTIDFLPTIAAIVGAPLPPLGVDGVDARPWLFGESVDHPAHDALYFYYHVGALEAVRSGRWKLHLPHHYRTLAGRPGGTGGKPVKYEQSEIGLSLFDLVADPGETTDVSADHPDVVARMLERVERARADLGDSAVGRVGANVRPPGRVPDEEPASR